MVEPRRLSIEQIKGKDLRQVHPVEWPGSGGKLVGLMELRCSEIQEAYFAARETFAKRGWERLDEVARMAFNEELELQYCYRMLVDHEAKVAKYRVFAKIEEARERLDPDERSHFAALHVELQNRKVTAWMPALKADEGESE